MYIFFKKVVAGYENYENDKDTDINILEVMTKESNVFSQEKYSALLKRIESNVKNDTDMKHEKKRTLPFGCKTLFMGLFFGASLLIAFGKCTSFP